MKHLIRRGNHYADFNISRLWPFSGKKQAGGLYFEASCATAFVPTPGWNKVTGISSLFIHKNSVRIVYQPAGAGMVRVAAYTYVRGVRQVFEIAKLRTNEWYAFEIRVEKDMYVVTIDGRKVVIPGKTFWPKFRCFPYFGGECTAPSDQTIYFI